MPPSAEHVSQVAQLVPCIAKVGIRWPQSQFRGMHIYGSFLVELHDGSDPRSSRCALR